MTMHEVKNRDGLQLFNAPVKNNTVGLDSRVKY